MPFRAAFGGGVRVDLQILLRQLVTILGAPDRRVAEEETLQTGETIDFRRLSQRSFNGLHGTVLLTACHLVKSERICFERNVHATQVAMFSPMVKAPFTCGA